MPQVYYLSSVLFVCPDLWSLSGVVPDFVTTYEYDGLTTTTNRGGFKTSSIRDGNGRVTSVTDPVGLVSTTNYTVSTRTTTITRPSGSTEITIRHKDGKIKSRTGTGIVASYYDYDKNATGPKTKVYTAINSGSRYMETQYDRAGRVSTVTSPDPDLSGTVVLTYGYDNSINRQDSLSSSASNVADVLYEYDSLGRLERGGQDEDDDGLLEDASSDTLVANESSFNLDGGLWWSRRTTTTWYGTGATDKRSETFDTRLSANSGGYVRQSKSTPATGDVVETKVAIDRTNKKVTTTTISNTGGTSTTVAKNGLFTSRRESYATADSTVDYDDLWRLVRTVGATGEITRWFYNGVGQLLQTSDHLGNVTGYAYVDPGSNGAGQVNVVRNGEGEKTETSYDALGRVSVVSGDGAYRRKNEYDVYGALEKLTTYRDYAGAPTVTEVTTWIYDAGSGVLKEKQYDDGKGPQYTYDTFAST